MAIVTFSEHTVATDMDALLAGMQSSLITGVADQNQDYPGTWLRFTLSNGLQVDARGTGLTATGAPGAYVLNGTVAFFTVMDATPGSSAVTVNEPSTPLASLFDTTTALLGGADSITGGGFTPQALHGYAGNDTLSAYDGLETDFGDLPESDSLYGGADDDTFILTFGFSAVELLNVDDPAPTYIADVRSGIDAIFGGTGTDTMVMNVEGGGAGYQVNMNRFNVAPNSIERLEINTFNDAAAIINVTPGENLAWFTSLTEIEGVGEMIAQDAGTIDLSGMTISAPTFTFSGFGGGNTFIAAGAYEGSTSITYVGGAADDNFTGNAASESMSGREGADVLSGLGGADTLDGESGNDTVSGGLGDDSLLGGGDDDLVEGGDGVDTLQGNAGLDTLQGGAGNDTLDGGTEADSLNGGADNDSLVGGDGADTLVGGDGADTLYGGAGDDLYIAGAGDVIADVDGVGTDTVETDISTNLGTLNFIENLTLLGAAAIDGRGNGLTNVITGNAAANYLTGGGGVDTLQGGGGNDTYDVGTGVTVIEAADAGIDTAVAFATYTLDANIERLTLLGAAAGNLTGNALANRLTGNDAANRMDGGALADTLIGFEGDDTYVYGAGDVIVEFAGGGTDTVESAVTVTLAANLERLVLSGALAINGTGNTVANHITGNGGANTLNGAGGADTLVGLSGDDTYISSYDTTIIEAAGGGTDTVRSNENYIRLSANVENLVLIGRFAADGIGNSQNNNIIGNGFNNRIDGGLGADTMTGLGGQDTYVVNSASDVVVEAYGGGQQDMVITAVNYRLTAGTNVEILATLDQFSQQTISLTGNEWDQQILGNNGNNVLNGGLGNDTLFGISGQDTFVFNTALGLENIDTIYQFSHPDDTIHVDNAVFRGIGPEGTLSRDAFKINLTGFASDESDRLIYNRQTHVLMYDSNGSVSGGTIRQFATLSIAAAFDYTDFVVI